MIREWCSYCGQRYEVTWITLGVTGCPKNCESLDFGDVGFAVADANAEIFWSAIAHERAETDRQREAERAERTSAAMRIMTGGPVISANELLASLKLDPTIPINTTPVLQTFIKAEKGKV